MPQRGEHVANPTCRILWWTMVASLAIYVIVAHVVEVDRSASTPPVSMLVPVFGVLAAGIAIGTAIYRRRALAEPIRAGTLDPTSPEGMELAFQPFLINLVLSESVGIFGLILAFLSGQPSYSVAFCAAAAGLMVFHRPTAPDLQPPLSSRHP